MAIIIICRGLVPERYDRALRALAPERDIRLWPEHGAKTDAHYALAWNPPAGELAEYENLRVIFSAGAGVEHLLGDPTLPDLPIVRLVDDNLTMRMGEYVVLHVLLHHRRMLEYQEQQRASTWRLLDQPAAEEIRVGILGLGELGADSARKLSQLGFQVAGWSRSKKRIAGVESFAGEAVLDAFLARTDILVALLPLTPATTGVLNGALLAKLARDGALPGPVLINAGRGGLQVEADILSALDDGTLWAASLDVFENEPLPEASPLWAHPRVVITPHNASISEGPAVAAYMLEQIAAFEAGNPLSNLVDPKRGY
jgi:glyoxylate/hydroxypyruvate reductase A